MVETIPPPPPRPPKDPDPVMLHTIRQDHVYQVVGASETPKRQYTKSVRFLCDNASPQKFSTLPRPSLPLMSSRTQDTQSVVTRKSGSTLVAQTIAVREMKSMVSDMMDRHDRNMRQMMEAAREEARREADKVREAASQEADKARDFLLQMMEMMIFKKASASKNPLPSASAPPAKRANKEPSHLKPTPVPTTPDISPAKIPPAPPLPRRQTISPPNASKLACTGTAAPTSPTSNDKTARTFVVQ